jgi:hypothetical protein
MEILTWIDKNISGVEGTLSYSRYFDSIPLEKGVDVLYLLNPYLGIDLIFTEQRYLKSIHFYSGEQNGMSRFGKELPHDLIFSFSRSQTIEILGKPNQSGGGGYSILYGTTPSWDKYYFERYALHLQFSEGDKSVVLVSTDSLIL